MAKGKSGKKRRKIESTFKDTVDDLKKQPKVDFDPDEQNISWHFGSIELEGPWSFGEMDRDTLLSVKEKLSRFESMRWKDLLRTRHKNPHHPMPVNKLCPEAIDRLGKIDLGQVAQLWQFGVNSVPKVWGFKEGSVCNILWWDPNHTVNPVEKRFT